MCSCASICWQGFFSNAYTKLSIVWGIGVGEGWQIGLIARGFLQVSCRSAQLWGRCFFLRMYSHACCVREVVFAAWVTESVDTWLVLFPGKIPLSLALYHWGMAVSIPNDLARCGPTFAYYPNRETAGMSDLRTRAWRWRWWGAAWSIPWMGWYARCVWRGVVHTEAPYVQCQRQTFFSNSFVGLYRTSSSNVCDWHFFQLPEPEKSFSRSRRPNVSAKVFEHCWREDGRYGD